MIPHQTRPKAAPPPAAPLRVLVIDDDDVARDVIIDVLQQEGHQVTSLPSPLGATKHIVDQQVDVVVLDVMMPSMRGDKLAMLLARNPKLKHLGVVLVTGAKLEEMNALLDELGSVAVVPKGGIQTELLPAVRKAGRR